MSANRTNERHIPALRFHLLTRFYDPVVRLTTRERTFKPELVRRLLLVRQTGDTAGDLAWVASESRLTGTSKGKPLDIQSTETLVLKKTADGWKVVHIHWSSRPVRQ